MNRLHVLILIGAITFSSGSYLTKRNRRCGSECIRDEHCDQGSVCERTTDACRRYICVKKVLQVPQVIDSVPHIDTVDKQPLRGDVYVKNDKKTSISSLDLPHPISPLGHSDIVKNGNKPWLIDPNSSTLTKIVKSNVGSDDTIDTLTGSKNVDLLQICINNCLMRTTCPQGTDCSLRCKTSCLKELSNINLTPSLPKGSIVPLELGPNGQILQAGTKIEIPGNMNTEFLSVNQQDGINPGQNEMVSSVKPIDSYVSSDSLRHKKEEHPIKLNNDYSLTDSSGNKNIVAPVQSVDTYVPNDSTQHKEKVPFVKSIDNYVPNDSQDHKVVMNRFTNEITSDGLGGGFVDRNGQVQPIDSVSLGKQTNIYDPKDSTGKKEVLQSNPILKGDHTTLIDPNFGTITKFETSSGGFLNEMDNLSGSNNAGLLKICIDNCVETSRCLQNDCRLGCQKLCLNELQLINIRPSLPEVQDVFRPQDQMNQIMQVGTGREFVGKLNTDMVSVNKETGIETIRREIVLPGKSIDTYVQKDLPVHQEVVGGRGGDLVHKSQIQQIDNFSPVEPIDDYIPKDLSVNSNVVSDGTVGTLSTSKNVGLLQICIDNCLVRITCPQGTDCILRCKNLCLNELPNNEFSSLPKDSIVPFVQGPNSEILHAGEKEVLTSNSGIHGDQAILIDPNSGTLTSMFRSPVDQSSPLKPIDAYVQNNLPGHKEVVDPVKSTDTYVQANMKEHNGVKPVFKPFDSTNQNDLPEHTEVVNRLTQVITSNGQGIGLEHNRHLQQIDDFAPVQPIDNYSPNDLSGHKEILTSNSGIHGDQNIPIDPNSGTLTSMFKSPVDQPSPLKPIDSYVQNNLPGHKEVVDPVKSTDTYVQGNMKEHNGVKPVFKPFDSTNQNDLPEHTEVVNRLTQVITSNGQGIGLEHNRHLQQIDDFSPVQPIDNYAPNDLSGHKEILTSNPALHKDQKILIDPNSGTIATMLTSVGKSIRNQQVKQLSPVKPIDSYVPKDLSGHNPISHSDRITTNDHIMLNQNTGTVNQLVEGDRLVTNRQVNQFGHNSPVEPDMYIPNNPNVQKIPAVGKLQKPILPLISSGPFAHNQNGHKIPDIGKLQKPILPLFSEGSFDQNQAITNGDEMSLKKTILTGQSNVLVDSNGQIQLIRNPAPIDQHSNTDRITSIDHMPVRPFADLNQNTGGCVSNCNRDFDCWPQGRCVQNGCKRSCMPRESILPVKKMPTPGNYKSKCDRDCPSGRICAIRRGRNMCIRKKLRNNYRKM